MPAEVTRERAGSRAGRRILSDSVERREHPCLPARSRARTGERTDEVELGQCVHVRPEAGNVLLRRQHDVRVADAVVVHLDRQLRALRRRAQRAARPRARMAATVGTGWVIRPKTIRPASSRSSSTGTMPLPVSSAITPSCSGAPSTNAVPRHGCPANGISLPRREDADTDGAAFARRQHEHGLGEARARAPAPASSPRRGRGRR